LTYLIGLRIKGLLRTLILYNDLTTQELEEEVALSANVLFLKLCHGMIGQS
jgi:hypothetical protein